MTLTPFERLELKRAKDRERINLLRSDPVYRASENSVERARHKERMATESEYRAHYNAVQREKHRRLRARIKHGEFQQAAE